jgi:hypothetical protein
MPSRRAVSRSVPRPAGAGGVAELAFLFGGGDGAGGAAEGDDLDPVAAFVVDDAGGEGGGAGEVLFGDAGRGIDEQYVTLKTA